MCMREPGLFLLPVWNLKSPLCFSTPVSCMMRKSGDSRIFNAEIDMFMFAWIFGILWLKTVFWGKIGEEVVRCWPQRTRS